MSRIALLLALALAAGGVPAQDDDQAAREAELKARLEAVRDEQRRIDVERAGARGQSRDLVAKLREDELAIARVAAEIAALDERIIAQVAEVARLDAEAAGIEARLATQRAALAALLRSAYAAGRHERLRILFAPEDLGRIERALAYHRYLQEARAGEVRGLLDRLDALARATAEVEARRTAQAAAAAAARRARDALAERRREQAEALRALKAGLVARAGEIEALRRDQRALERLLADLRDAIADVPKQLADDRPFASRRGELPLPVQGRVLRRFGAPVAGALTSDGVQFAADEGSAVRAVAPGRVVYADWLRGQGLLLVIDHGGGWMTLYGNAQRLARDVGDWVSAGEVVARAGRSGGAQASGIYFELRRDGQPVDPRGWWR